MALSDHPELYWLTATVALTALLWLPYIVRFIAEIGLGKALWDPTGEHPIETPWAQRARRAHANAVENLVVFAPLAILVAQLGVGDSTTATAAMVFFFARLAHFVIYLFGLPVVRTLAFAVCWVCQVVLLLRLFGMI